ncbi:UNVERIFIED_CONTAM: hypothetical protein Scaly_2426700 [Sesamum calycinum]|uniref:Uncharacterized protein n=1 Tax=Sesamum calycinum TaxID=2727403 RepID=A0AAW2M3I6_9LAMI
MLDQAWLGRSSLIKVIDSHDIDKFDLCAMDKEVGEVKESKNKQFGYPTILRVMSKREDDLKALYKKNMFASGLLDLIYSDICGPLNTEARGGFTYFITFTDDHSWYGYVYLKRKSFQKEAQREICSMRNQVRQLLKQKQQLHLYYLFTPVIFQISKDANPKTYREVMLDIDPKKWLEAMKFEMDSMSLNKMDVKVDFLMVSLRKRSTWINWKDSLPLEKSRRRHLDIENDFKIL